MLLELHSKKLHELMSYSLSEKVDKLVRHLSLMGGLIHNEYEDLNKDPLEDVPLEDRSLRDAFILLATTALDIMSDVRSARIYAMTINTIVTSAKNKDKNGA